jgi:hypothetical protein
MSYSFNARGETKDAAKAAVAAQFDLVVKNQPIHARDRAAALANANAAIDILVDDAGKHVSVSCSGYVSWLENLRDDSSNDLTTVNVSASASLVEPQPGTEGFA